MALQTLTNEGYYRGSQTLRGIGHANSLTKTVAGSVTSTTVVLNNTTDLVVGMLVVGNGLNPPTIYKIATIVNATTITLDTTATIADASVLTFVPIISTEFTLVTSNFDPLPTSKGEFSVYINNTLVSDLNYTYSSPTLTFTPTMANVDTQELSTGAPLSDYTISVELIAYDREYGSYQNIKLQDIINNFMISYVGENKIISKIKRTDVAFHAQRAIQELNYDTLTSSKSQEIEIPTSLVMTLQDDYVNYTKVSWADNNGVERMLYPVRKVSNPSAILQDSDFEYIIGSDGKLTYAENSETWKRYKDETIKETPQTDDSTDSEIDKSYRGGRFGLEPEHAQANGGFFIDKDRGRIYFTSNVSGKVVVLHYISDGVSTDNVTVHKFAEEAIYKCITYAILSTRTQVPEYVLARFKKERFAEVRKAKLRLSNIKTEEIAQVMKGKAKWIKR